MSLRTRLALLVALAVAFGVALVAVAAGSRGEVTIRMQRAPPEQRITVIVREADGTPIQRDAECSALRVGDQSDATSTANRGESTMQSRSAM